MIAKLHPRLDHNGNHPGPGFIQSLLGKGFPSQLHRSMEILRFCYAQPLIITLGTAGGRHFRSDDVNRGNCPRVFLEELLVSCFRSLTELGGALSNKLGIQSYSAIPVITQVHTGIQVNFAEPGPHIFLHQHLGFGHGFRRRFLPPGVGAQVIAPQDDSILGKARLRRYTCDELHKIPGHHAGVAPVLVHLVARGFDQHSLVVLSAEFQQRFQNELVGAAYGKNAQANACLVFLNKFT